MTKSNANDTGHTEVDLSESSIYGDHQTEPDGPDSDDTATEDRLDRLEAITGGAEEPPIFTGKLARQADAFDAGTEEELDALEIDLTQDDSTSREGSGRVIDDVAEEQIAAFTEVGPMSEDRGGESVAPGREDTSAAMLRRRPHSDVGHSAATLEDDDAILEGNIDEPLDAEKPTAGE